MANELTFESGLVAIIRTKTADDARAAATALIAAGVDSQCQAQRFPDQASQPPCLAF